MFVPNLPKVFSAIASISNSYHHETFPATHKRFGSNQQALRTLCMNIPLLFPYSGVKTSILLMDKTLAKKTGEILFVKVSNDGFDLGAQRRPIEKNDLPQALKIVKAWKKAIAKGKSFGLDETDKTIAHTVSKKKIAEFVDYNLSGGRYREAVSYANVKWPMVVLGEVCDFFDDGDWVKRNIDRFPNDFMFQLIAEEYKSLRFHFGILEKGRHSKYLPYAFTEQGVAMLSSVLKSKRAVQVNIEIMRAFVRLRRMLSVHKDLERKLTDLEQKYDEQFKIVFDAIRALMAPPEKPRKIYPVKFRFATCF